MKRPLNILLIILLALATGSGGWLLGRQTAPKPPAYDQKAAVLEAVDNFCKTGYVQGPKVDETGKKTLRSADWHIAGEKNYDNPQFFKQQDNFIRLSAGCSNTQGTDNDGFGDSYLLKQNSDKTWFVVAAEQQAPSCYRLDGYGIPKALIGCYDDTTKEIRDPK